MSEKSGRQKRNEKAKREDHKSRKFGFQSRSTDFFETPPPKKTTMKKKEGSQSQYSSEETTLSHRRKKSEQCTEKKRKSKFSKFSNQKKLKKKQKAKKIPSQKSQIKFHPLQKLFLSMVLATIIMYSLPTQEQAQQNSSFALLDGYSQKVFEITAIKRSQQFTFPIKHSKKESFWLFQVDSTKTATVKATLSMSIGFSADSVEVQDSDYGQHYHINFSQLKVLQYDIKNVKFLDRENGFWNTWEFDDHGFIEQTIEDKYLTQLGQQAISSIKTIEKDDLAYKLEAFIHEDFSLFRMIQRINKYVDKTVRKYLTHQQTKKKSKNKSEKIVNFIH